MAKTQINPILLVGGAVGLYLLLQPQSSSQPGLTPGTPQTNSLLNNLLPQQTQQIPTNYGINSGIKGGNGSYYLCANYSTLLQYNGNLGNPNYVMTDIEINQYLQNYSDLQQAMPTWLNIKQANGIRYTTVQTAAQYHWKLYGCADKRIFLPLVPPSAANYIPPPRNINAQSSGGSNWVGTALNVAGSVAVALLGIGDQETPKLNDAEVNILVTGSAIVKNILLFYLEVQPELVNSIQNKIDNLVSQYAN